MDMMVGFLQLWLSILFIGWYVEWIEITMNTGEKSHCPFNAWLDNGAPGTPQAVAPSAGPPSNPAGPPSATSICNQGNSCVCLTFAKRCK